MTSKKPGQLQQAAKTSEFWGVVLGAVAMVAQIQGWISEETWKHIAWFLGPYVVMRSTSKMANKRAPFTPPAT